LAVPAPTIVKVLPETVATAVLSLLYDTGKPDEAVAVSVIGESPKVAGAKALKVIVCASWPTVNPWLTLTAGEKLPLPACEAVMLAVPAPTIVKVLPETVATAVLSLLYDTGKPDEAVAVSVIGESPKVAGAKALNVIVCASFPTVNDWLTGVAAKKLVL